MTAQQPPAEPAGTRPDDPHHPTAPNLSRLWSIRVREHGHDPFLTYYDEVSGERTELSYATFDNWASKAANLLVEEFEVARGDSVILVAPGHWAAAVVVVGCWKVGAVAVLSAADDAMAEPPRVIAAPESLAEGLAAAGAPVLALGAGMGGRLVRADLAVTGFAEEVLAFADDYDDPCVTASDPAAVIASRTWSQEDLMAPAPVPAGARIVVTEPLDAPHVLVAGLAGSAARGGSLVWCRNLDGDAVAARASAERAGWILTAAGAMAT